MSNGDLYAGIMVGFLAGLIFLTLAVVFLGNPNIMEDHAEVFCNKNGQGLLDYEAELWDFKNITCGGKEENTVIERNYKLQEVNTYDVFMED